MSRQPLMATDGPPHRSVEIAVAIICLIFGGITIFGSLSAGIGWGAEGPQSGFFPFYIGVIIILSSLINLKNAWALDPQPLFANWGQLGQVLAVVIPTTVYVLVLPYTGIYVSSIVLITGFMIWLGRYRWHTALIVGVAVPVAIYFMFEKWFLVPLPKGPLEDWLGL
ncbi:MAG: tripartite tricarboxylate transporter TctB family protein [Rhizobiales bacterium]|nr:tripartite tricarboxylate transporter TctB family protein [Hyphomicrobiales bacterium]OJY44605.1 MAG: tricarboxylate transporter [Rhizobiales bacterium 64-17]